jgi:hypothetical protein
MIAFGQVSSDKVIGLQKLWRLVIEIWKLEQVHQLINASPVCSLPLDGASQ